MLVAFLIYNEFGLSLCVGMLVLMCWHVGPRIEEAPTQPGSSYCHVFFFLYFLKVKFTGTSAMLDAFLICYEFWLALCVGMLVPMSWHVGPGIDKMTTQVGFSYCLVLFFLKFLKVKFRWISAMLVAFLIYYEFWLFLFCWHVGPDVFKCLYWDRGGANSDRFVILTCLGLFVVPECKVQRDFCNASCLSDLLLILAGPCVLACWS